MNNGVAIPIILPVANEETRLTAPPTKAKRKKRWWVIVIDIVLIVVFALALAVSANVIYLTSVYGEPFYVNGASMYPTLNKNGYKLEDGEYVPLSWADAHNGEGDIVDYGWAKAGEKGNWRASLSRYDIVITYFESDYSDPDNLILRDSASLKIKRVVGMPGETVTLEYDSSNTAWTSVQIPFSMLNYEIKSAESAVENSIGGIVPTEENGYHGVITFNPLNNRDPYATMQAIASFDTVNIKNELEYDGTVKKEVKDWAVIPGSFTSLTVNGKKITEISDGAVIHDGTEIIR